MANADHVVEHHAAVLMNLLHHIVRRSQAGDDDRHAMPHTGIEVALEPVIRVVDDLVHRIGCDLRIRVRLGVMGERRLDAVEPLVQRFGGARVQRRERADDTALALLYNQLGVADDEHRRADHRQHHLVSQFFDQDQVESSSLLEPRNLPACRKRVKRDRRPPAWRQSVLAPFSPACIQAPDRGVNAVERDITALENAAGAGVRATSRIHPARGHRGKRDIRPHESRTGRMARPI